MIEEFLDLRIATIVPDEAPPLDAHWVRIVDPDPQEATRRVAQGWFYKPNWVTYVIAVPRSLDEYIERTFRSRGRNKPRKLLREVPLRYRFSAEPAACSMGAFRELYRRTVVARPRGRDRLGEQGSLGPGWWGFSLYDGAAMVAGVLVQESPGHLSVGYGAFDPERRREMDLEHFLLMQVLQRSIELGHMALSLGVDTNRYGHHLSLRLPAYKLRLGFTPMAYEPGGRELARIQSFEPFEDGLFFYAYEGRKLVGHFFGRGEPDVRPYVHHNGPLIRVHVIPGPSDG
ncbi:MAG: GNAT family N-acetyltransferase [Planctomycetes bacterium]|nr:GNAT family N-acetyltransferase [Planctomycetota bacterium]